jgi:hypothetical protein
MQRVLETESQSSWRHFIKYPLVGERADDYALLQKLLIKQYDTDRNPLYQPTNWLLIGFVCFGSIWSKSSLYACWPQTQKFGVEKQRNIERAYGFSQGVQVGYRLRRSLVSLPPCSAILVMCSRLLTA